jgi:hypothetical protein
MSKQLMAVQQRADWRPDLLDYLFAATLALVVGLDHFHIGPSQFLSRIEVGLVFGVLGGLCYGLLDLCFKTLGLDVGLQRLCRTLVHPRKLWQLWRYAEEQTDSWERTDMLLHYRFAEVVDVTEPYIDPDLVELYQDAAYARTPTLNSPRDAANTGQRMARRVVFQSLTLRITRDTMPTGRRLLFGVGGGLVGSGELVYSVLQMALQLVAPQGYLLLGLVVCMLWTRRQRRRPV